jgi:CheY-like chemotaxis protein
VGEIYAAALDALAEGIGVSRASILLFDPDGVMRFKAYRGLSETRRAVEGHTPWNPGTRDPQPIVVGDVAMPGIDGYELLERVRRTRGRIPAVAVSAYARPEDRARALAAGYNDYCAKPLEASELLRTVGNVLSAS